MAINSFPIYGVEPYNPLGVAPATDYGGGANVTQENLLITLWTNPGAEDLDIPGELIKPAAYSAAGQADPTFQPAFSQQAFRSRLSTRFAYVGGDQEGDTEMLAILNPPQELREAFLLNKPANLPALGLTKGLTLWCHWVWEAFLRDLDGEFEGGEIAFSGFSPTSQPIAFAKTNGADGVWPEFYPLASLDDFAATIEAFRGGAPFYIAAVIEAEDDASIIDIRWPFSGAARG